MKLLIEMADQGRLPDSMIRRGIRLLNGQRLRQENRRAGPDGDKALDRFIAHMAESPVALHPPKANQQHYEVPTDFFKVVLGPHMKYSSGYWPEGVHRLDQSEAAMLELTCRRADIKDNMEILELGCGWGSLSLWIARHYPQSRILAVSNSNTQREYIQNEAAGRNLANLEVVTADMNHFDTHRHFDRVISVEMFEHMRNWPRLLNHIHQWLAPSGKLFIHIFAHRDFAYPFEIQGPSDWMGRYFFTGGIMPAHGLLPRIETHLKTQIKNGLRVEQTWRVNGRHYQKTAEAWLEAMDRQKERILPIMAETYGPANAGRWFQRWRIFFMACAELFGHDRGRSWGVSHYRLEKT